MAEPQTPFCRDSDLAVPPFSDGEILSAPTDDRQSLRKSQGLPSLEKLWIDVTPAERAAALELKAAAEAILRPLSSHRTTKAALDGLPRQRQRARDALAALTEAAKERRADLRVVRS